MKKNDELIPEFLEFIRRAERVVLNKEHEFKLAWACIAAQGHLLIEDKPGMGKTSFVRCIAELLGMPWKRIQCTNDLLPVDITGGNVLVPSSGEFSFIPGPIFANVVMADELNRASPKSQSAFLQAMEEHSISVDSTTHILPEPFVVIATQNPLDSAGTNPLPESQLDRFMMVLSLGLPGRKAEMQLLTQPSAERQKIHLDAILTLEAVRNIQKDVQEIFVSPILAEYVLNLVEYLRGKVDSLSTRSVQMLVNAGRAWAHLHSRTFVTIGDIQDVAVPTLSHRIKAANFTSAQSVGVIKEAIQCTKAP
ncbi:MAG: AAA family ATPase [Proteobacteria bacterium]|nr:AAA family ATPase [Pseudomonadota bacterium]